MRDELLPYYERELTFIRQMAAEFAEKYPKVAGRLHARAGYLRRPARGAADRSVCAACGRVHHKLDDEFPEITEALLDVLYPHYLRPVPSQAIAQFQLDEAQSAAASTQVPAGHRGPQQGGRRTVLLFPHLLSGDALAAARHRRFGIERKPISFARRSGGCRGRGADRDGVPGGDSLWPPADRFDSILSEWGQRRRSRAIRGPVPAYAAGFRGRFAAQGRRARSRPAGRRCLRSPASPRRGNAAVFGS